MQEKKSVITKNNLVGNIKLVLNGLNGKNNSKLINTNNKDFEDMLMIFRDTIYNSYTFKLKNYNILKDTNIKEVYNKYVKLGYYVKNLGSNDNEINIWNNEFKNKNKNGRGNLQLYWYPKLDYNKEKNELILPTLEKEFQYFKKGITTINNNNINNLIFHYLTLMDNVNSKKITIFEMDIEKIKMDIRQNSPRSVVYNGGSKDKLPMSKTKIKTKIKK